MLPKTAKDTKDSQSRLDFFLMLHVYKKIELPCFCQQSTSSIIWMVDVLLMAHEVLPRYYYMQV